MVFYVVDAVVVVVVVVIDAVVVDVVAVVVVAVSNINVCQEIAAWRRMILRRRKSCIS